MDTLLGIDLGTTGIKAAICSPDGHLLGESYLEYPLIRPAPGIVEQDAEAWWALTQEAIRQAVSAAQVQGHTVRALSASSQGISFVAVDHEGRPLDRAINWLDTRATVQAEAIRDRYSDADLFALTGKRASPAYVLPKLLWLRQHKPHLYRRTHKFLMAHDYLVRKLTGQSVTDHSLAGGTLLYDVSRLSWSQELLETFDIAVEQLPAIRWAGNSLGPIRAEVADELGLSRNVVIVVGGQDQKCAALGASIRPGVATISLGTASAISCLTERPVLDPERRIPAYPFVVPGYWDLEGVVGTAGGALRWLRETFFPHETYKALGHMAEESPPGANGVSFFPHLSGANSPHWQLDVWGAFTGLSLATGPEDIVRSVLEGVAFQIRENLDALDSMGLAIDELTLFGGGAQNPFWSQMISDIANKSATATEMVDVANWGACILAGIGAGILEGDIWDISKGKKGGSRWSPRPETVKRYRDIYARYRTQETRLMGAAEGP